MDKLCKWSMSYKSPMPSQVQDMVDQRLKEEIGDYIQFAHTTQDKSMYCITFKDQKIYLNMIVKPSQDPR